jgi:NTP pyrophosphatase (non-canonical NTP hydrolase)
VYDITFNFYQNEAVKTVVYDPSLEVMYPALGLCGEAGEVAEKVKKIYRDDGGVCTHERKIALMKEMGDVLWYLAVLADDLDVELRDIAHMNLNKLQQRRSTNKLHGDGDNR